MCKCSCTCIYVYIHTQTICVYTYIHIYIYISICIYICSGILQWKATISDYIYRSKRITSHKNGMHPCRRMHVGTMLAGLVGWYVKGYLGSTIVCKAGGCIMHTCAHGERECTHMLFLHRWVVGTNPYIVHHSSAMLVFHIVVGTNPWIVHHTVVGTTPWIVHHTIYHLIGCTNGA